MTCKARECRLLSNEYKPPLSDRQKEKLIEDAGKRAMNRVRQELTQMKISAHANGIAAIDSAVDGKGFKLYSKLLASAFFRYYSVRFLAQTGQLVALQLYVDTPDEVLKNAASLAKHRFTPKEWWQRHICIKCRHGSVVADGCEKIWCKICKGFYAHLVMVDDTKVLDQLDVASACTRTVQRGNQYRSSSQLCSSCNVRSNLLGSASEKVNA